MLFRSFVCTLFILLLTVILLSGCTGGPTRPADLPPLYPCTLTITQDGKPLGEATVSLTSADPAFKWTVYTQTDSSGTGKVFTQGLFPGAPEGEYKVVIVKEEVVSEQSGPTITRQGEFGEESYTPTTETVFSLVEKEYTDAATTPLSITIGKKGNNQTLDCGKPVREKLHVVTP